MSQLLNSSSNAYNASCRNSSSRTERDPEPTKFLLPSLVVLLSFMCLLIVAVNSLVIFLMHKKKTLRTLTNMFLTSLALSDLMSGLVGIPLLVICLVKEIINVCVSSTIFIRFTAISSVCHVLLIGCDRYIFIVHYMKYRFLVTKRRAIVAIAIVWLFSFSASVIQLSWNSVNETALTEVEETTEYINIKYSQACIVLFFAVPLLMMCCMYGRIFYISFKHIKTDRQMSYAFQQPSRSVLQEWRGRSVLLITVVIFASCWLPYFLAMLDDYMESSKKSPMPVWVQRLLIFLAFIPPMLNPIMCTLAKKDFRRALKETLLERNCKTLSVHFNARREQVSLNLFPYPIQSTLIIAYVTARVRQESFPVKPL